MNKAILYMLVIQIDILDCAPETILPNARLVSNTFCPDKNISSSMVTQFFTIFSQFVDHDLTLTLDHGTAGCCQTPNDSTCINVIVPPRFKFIYQMYQKARSFS